MKKLLLLILTITTATTLISCGGTTVDEEIEKDQTLTKLDTYLEKHTNDGNYELKYNNNTYEIDGNLMYVNGLENIYEINSDSVSYWYNESLWFYDIETNYDTGRSEEVSITKEISNKEFVKTEEYNAYTGPFSQLIEENKAIFGNDGLTSDKFKYTENGNEVTYYFAKNESATIEETEMTIVLEYNSNEIVKSTVEYKNNTWEYTKFDSITLVTPDETLIEYIISLANNQIDMTLIFEYDSNELTAEINSNTYKITGNNINQYIVENSNSTITVYEGIEDYWTQRTITTDVEKEIPEYFYLKSILSNANIDSKQVTEVTGTGNQTTGSKITYLESNANELNIDDTYAAIRTNYLIQTNDDLIINEIQVYSYNGGSGYANYFESPDDTNDEEVTPEDNTTEENVETVSTQNDIELTLLYTIVSFNTYSEDETLESEIESLDIRYSITFEYSDGTTVTLMTNAFGTLDVLADSPTDFELGYEFGGWYNGLVKIDETTIFDQDTTLSPETAITQYTITYILGAGENNPLNVETYTIFTGEITIYSPTSTDGLTFTGWSIDVYVAADGTIYENVITSKIPAGSHRNIVLTAVWGF